MKKKYKIYYMDNDRQRIVVAENLEYYEIFKFMAKNKDYYHYCSLNWERQK